MARPKGPPGQGRQRVLDAALVLFAEYGVSGTSLQMIADHLGVTKAAVYHQFHAKDDIALALLAPLFEAMTEVVDEAEAVPGPRRLGAALNGFVRIILDQRQIFGTLNRDPELERLVGERPEFQSVVARLQVLLLGTEPSPARRIAVSLFASGVVNCAVDPELADISDADMRAELEGLARKLIGR